MQVDPSSLILGRTLPTITAAVNTTVTQQLPRQLPGYPSFHSISHSSLSPPLSSSPYISNLRTLSFSSYLLPYSHHISFFFIYEPLCFFSTIYLCRSLFPLVLLFTFLPTASLSLSVCVSFSVSVCLPACLSLFLSLSLCFSYLLNC